MFKKYHTLFLISLSESFQYKAHGLVYTTYDLIPTLISMVFWSRAFETQPIVSGYTPQELISYFLITGFIRAMIISYPESTLSREINNGYLNQYLLKPYSFIRHAFIEEVSFKFVRALFAIPSLCILTYIALQLVGSLPQVQVSVFTPAIILISFTIVFLFKFIIGLSAIWTTEISWLLGITDLATLILSGGILPLDFFPRSLQQLFSYLPFQYASYIPTKSLQGDLTYQEQMFFLTIGIVWVIILYSTYKIVWNKGKRAYAAYGS